jgi:hypothetical protein
VRLASSNQPTHVKSTAGDSSALVSNFHPLQTLVSALMLFALLVAG